MARKGKQSDLFSTPIEAWEIVIPEWDLSLPEWEIDLAEIWGLPPIQFDLVADGWFDTQLGSSNRTHKKRPGSLSKKK